jgi:hypothetical protein
MRRGSTQSMRTEISESSYSVGNCGTVRAPQRSCDAHRNSKKRRTKLASCAPDQILVTTPESILREKLRHQIVHGSTGSTRSGDCLDDQSSTLLDPHELEGIDESEFATRGRSKSEYRVETVAIDGMELLHQAHVTDIECGDYDEDYSYDSYARDSFACSARKGDRKDSPQCNAPVPSLSSVIEIHNPVSAGFQMECLDHFSTRNALSLLVGESAAIATVSSAVCVASWNRPGDRPSTSLQAVSLSKHPLRRPSLSSQSYGVGHGATSVAAVAPLSQAGPNNRRAKLQSNRRQASLRRLSLSNSVCESIDEHATLDTSCHSFNSLMLLSDDVSPDSSIDYGYGHMSMPNVVDASSTNDSITPVFGIRHISVGGSSASASSFNQSSRGSDTTDTLDYGKYRSTARGYGESKTKKSEVGQRRSSVGSYAEDSVVRVREKDHRGRPSRIASYHGRRLSVGSYAEDSLMNGYNRSRNQTPHHQVGVRRSSVGSYAEDSVDYGRYKSTRTGCGRRDSLGSCYEDDVSLDISGNRSSAAVITPVCRGRQLVRQSSLTSMTCDDSVDYGRYHSTARQNTRRLSISSYADDSVDYSRFQKKNLAPATLKSSSDGVTCQRRLSVSSYADDSVNGARYRKDHVPKLQVTRSPAGLSWHSAHSGKRIVIDGMLESLDQALFPGEIPKGTLSSAKSDSVHSLHLSFRSFIDDASINTSAGRAA